MKEQLRRRRKKRKKEEKEEALLFFLVLDKLKMLVDRIYLSGSTTLRDGSFSTAEYNRPGMDSG